MADKYELEPQPTEYLLIPCSGLTLAGTTRNHIFFVKQRGQSAEDGIGWMTMEEAQSRLSDASFTVSTSHDLCPPCGQAWDKAAEEFFDS